MIAVHSRKNVLIGKSLGPIMLVHTAEFLLCFRLVEQTGRKRGTQKGSQDLGANIETSIKAALPEPDS